jgi:UDPglucose--hexose-1-phosphate uridylyltransferase
MIEFKRIIQKCSYLNPFDNFCPSEGEIEIRWDPLTRMTSRIVHFPARKFPRYNYEDTIRASGNVKCPFCPENIDSMTSRFRKEFYGFEVFESNGVRVIPNLLTFDKYCLVAIISAEHFVDLYSLGHQDYVVKGIRALLDVLRVPKEKDRQTKYFSINCNYMPMSGSSILHPHLQAIAGEHPTNYHGMILKESSAFASEKGNVFWERLMEKEMEVNERFIGRIGRTFWHAPFAPRGNIDVGCIFDKNSIFDIDGESWSDFGKGLTRLFAYFDGENVPGFNLSLFSGIEGEDYFRANARIVARRFLPPLNAADSNYFDKIHMESACLFFPEDVSSNVKAEWVRVDED